MAIASDIAAGIVAFLHLYFLYLEMFMWKQPMGRRVFGLDPEFAERSAGLAANQGLYNGFLAAGLIWGILAPDALAFSVKLFFFACVLVAGVFGAITAKRSILYIQALPGLVGLILTVLAGQ